MQLVLDAILFAYIQGYVIIDAFNHTQKERSDDTNDTQLPVHVLVSCPDHMHLLVRDSLVNQVNLMGLFPE